MKLDELGEVSICPILMTFDQYMQKVKYEKSTFFLGLRGVGESGGGEMIACANKLKIYTCLLLLLLMLFSVACLTRS